MTIQTVLCTHILNARFGSFRDGFEQRPANAQGGDETITLVSFPNGLWAIKSPDGQDWLSIQPDGSFGWRPVSDPTQPGPWEFFSLSDHTLTEFPKSGFARPLVQIIVRDLPSDADSTSPLPALHVEDKDFVTATGERYVVIGSTELLLAHKFDTEGPDAILPILEERHELGFNNLRVLWQKDIRNQKKPWQMPVDKMPLFLALCDEVRCYVQGCILADCQEVNPSASAQHARVNAVRLATRGIANHLEQLGNEYDKNGFDPRTFTKPTDRVSTLASGMDGFTDTVWDFFTFSGDRGPAQKAIREYGPIEVMYHTNKPAICDEGMVPGEPYSDPREFERAGAQARSGAGGRFHSRAGSNRDPGPTLARLFTPLERACAAAFIEGLRG